MIGVSSKKLGISLLAAFPIIMTILDPYSLTVNGSILICDMLVLIIAVLMLLSKRLAIYKPLFILLCIDVLLTIFSFLVTSSANTDLFLAIKVAVVFMLYLIVYSSVWSRINKDYFFSAGEAIGLVCAGLAIAQFIFASMGYNFYDGKLPLPLSSGSYFGGLFDRNTGDVRVHSFFEEPSYLAFFQIPITTHLVQEKKYMKATICAISCVLSGSLTGILGLIISVLAMVFMDREIELKYKYRLCLFMAVIVTGFAIFYSINLGFKTLIDYYINRLTTTELAMQRSDSSFSQRIIGNSALFNQYNLLNKWIGVGFNQYSLYFGLFKDYSNDLVSNLLNFGIVGLVSLVGVLLYLFKSSCGHGRIFVIIFILLLAIDHSWFGTMFFYMLTWVELKSENNSTLAYCKVRK